MSRQPLRIVRDTNAAVAAYTGPAGEPVFNRDTGRLHVQDGGTRGGQPMLKVNETLDGVAVALPDMLTDLRRWRGRSAYSPRDFGAVPDNGATDNITALRAMIAAAQASGRSIIWDGQYGISDTLTIPAGVMSDALAGSVLIAIGNVPIGVVLGPGNTAGKIELPILQNFSSVALRVRTSLARISVQQILGIVNGTAVQFYAAEGNAVLDSIVDVNAISVCRNGVAFYSDNAQRVIQGCGLHYSFITHTKFPVLFEGTPCFWDGQFVEGKAIDMTPEHADGAVMLNTTGVAIPRFSLVVSSWFGGDGIHNNGAATGAKLAVGEFEHATLDLCLANDLDFKNVLPNTIRGSRIRTRDMNPDSGYVMSSTAGKANYAGNAGAYSKTHILLTASLTGDVQPFQVFDVYFYSVWAQDASYRGKWQATFRDAATGPGNTGSLVVVSVIDDSPAELGRVRVRLMNASPNVLPGALNGSPTSIGTLVATHVF